MTQFVQLAPAQLADWLASVGDSPEAGGVLIDVREAWEWQAANVSASAVLPKTMRVLHIPLRELPAKVDELDTSVPTALLCHHGVRSLNAGHFLAQHGFEQLANVHGGIDAWARSADSSIPLY